MTWTDRAGWAILYAAVGGCCGAIGGVVFIWFWTALASGLPLKYVWQYIRSEPGYALFVTGFVTVGIFVGLIGGLVKGLRRK